MTSSIVGGTVFARIVDAYDRLAAKRAAGLPFVSDWNGEHAYTQRFLGELARYPLTELGELGRYSFPQEDEQLHRAVNAFHIHADGATLAPRVLLLGGGATAMLAIVVQLLRDQGRTEVHYLAPLHYTLTALLDRERLGATPVATRQTFEPGFELKLPKGSGHTLILSDPIWQVGRPVPAHVIEQIRRWQEHTGSLVVVDGTFQYLGWHHRGENSHRLHPELTLRLVCPTKTLSLNGFRFSYLIIPKPFFVPCAVIKDLYHGTTSLSDHLFARAAMAALCEDAHVPMLVEAEQAFARLRDHGRIEDCLEPVCGYFAFVKPAFDPETVAAMGPEHFGMTGFDGWVRVNLMSPDARRVLMPE